MAKEKLDVRQACAPDFLPLATFPEDLPGRMETLMAHGDAAHHLAAWKVARELEQQLCRVPACLVTGVDRYFVTPYLRGLRGLPFRDYAP